MIAQVTLQQRPYTLVSTRVPDPHTAEIAQKKQEMIDQRDRNQEQVMNIIRDIDRFTEGAVIDIR